MEEYKKSHKNNKSEISAQTWDKEFELPDLILYQVFKIISISFIDY